MKYYLIDDCTSKCSIGWTRRIEADSFEDALQKAHALWAGLTRHDRNDRDSFLVGEVADEVAVEIEDGEYAGNYMYGKTFEFAANYSIKPEYVEYWGDIATADEDISVDEIFRLAFEWDTTVESLIEQIEEV